MEQRDYGRDIAEIRSMMERSTKFLSLSGWSGILAGVYAFAGLFVAKAFLNFHPDDITYPTTYEYVRIPELILLALAILAAAIGTAVFLSARKAKKRGERLWSATSRRMLSTMLIPLLSGGVLILILISKGILGIIPSLTLIFYGLALYHTSKFTYEDVKFLGVIQIILGLASAHFVEYSLFFWATGFGVAHIVYGIYIHISMKGNS